ncbi:lysozyme inhibitor LprI family protein [Erwinia sp. Leaf53]|uniref:lysozyme inhibitor LprI family protein n=1 Tax=Erwinia sp. Leaf53 TaxID=1736225 RepID=UPI0009EBADA8|nr:lysozyme inhibitor LprI family protein [Erwinia sp. Leaf53]
MKKFMRKKAFYILPLIISSAASYAASFDCSKASASYEQIICSDNVLNRMDEALSNNYRAVMNSDRSQRIKELLKKDQIAWLNKRNACNEYSCIRSLYEWRVDAICEQYGSFTEKSSCISTNDISKQINREREQAKQEDQENRIPSRDVLQSLVNKYSSEVSNLGFSKKQLSSSIYISLSSSYVRYFSLQEYLSLMFDTPGLKSITRIDNDDYFGFQLKVAGSPSTGFTFKVEDDELYLNGIVNGNNVIEVVTAGQANQLSNTFYVYAVQVLNRNNAKL